MAATKKVFVGSLFEFTAPGVDQVVDQFKKRFPDSSTAPFVVHDRESQTFSFTVDRNDNTTAPYILSQLKSYLDFHESRQHELDDDILLRPMEGTVVRGSPRHQEMRTVRHDLVEYDDDDDSEDQDVWQSLQHITAYWKPANGDLNILTTGIAKEIAELTACGLHPEPAEKRMRLVGGDFNLALEKLQNLDPLLVCHSPLVLTPDTDTKAHRRSSPNNALMKLPKPPAIFLFYRAM